MRKATGILSDWEGREELKRNRHLLCVRSKLISSNWMNPVTWIRWKSACRMERACTHFSAETSWRSRRRAAARWWWAARWRRSRCPRWRRRSVRRRLWTKPETVELGQTGVDQMWHGCRGRRTGGSRSESGRNHPGQGEIPWSGWAVVVLAETLLASKGNLQNLPGFCQLEPNHSLPSSNKTSEALDFSFTASTNLKLAKQLKVKLIIHMHRLLKCEDHGMF